MSLAAPLSRDPEIRQGSFRIDPAELAALDLPEPRAFAVPANTLIVADTFGFHARGPSAGRSVRVEIWAYGPAQPVCAVAGPRLVERRGIGAAQPFELAARRSDGTRRGPAAPLARPQRHFRL